MPATFAVVLGLTLVDSINPVRLVITLHLLTRSVPVSRTGSYIGGIFTTSLTSGVLLMLGVDALLHTFQDALETPAACAIEGVIGDLVPFLNLPR